MGNIFKIYHQKLVTDSSYSSFIVCEIFLSKVPILLIQKNCFLIWDTRVFLYEITNWDIS